VFDDAICESHEKNKTIKGRKKNVFSSISEKVSWYSLSKGEKCNLLKHFMFTKTSFVENKAIKAMKHTGELNNTGGPRYSQFRYIAMKTWGEIHKKL
jgi:hypothetical protein